MEELLDRLGNIAVVPVELRRVRLEKSKKEKILKPEKNISLKEWRDEKLAAVKVQYKEMARSICTLARGEIISTFSVEGYKEGVSKRLDKLSPELKEILIPLVTPIMEEDIYSIDLDAWNKRMDGIDRAIVNLENRLPPRYSIDLINKHKDYPGARIGYDDRGKPWDKWLTMYLLGKDSKKKIYFEPYEDWLLEFEKIHPIYVKEHQEEQDRLHPQAPPPVEPPPSPEPVISSGVRAFYEMGREQNLESEADLVAGGRRPSVIYGGNKR